MKRQPRGIINTKRSKQAALIPSAQSFHDGLLAQAVTFPTPPVVLTDFQTLIDTYQSSLVAARKGTKTQTEAKDMAKQNLINGFRSNVTYVNEVVTKTYQANPNMNLAALRKLILSTGLKNSKIVTRPNTNGNSRLANTISVIAKNLGKTGANVNGVLKVRVTASPKYGSQRIKTFWLQYRTPGVTPGPWIDFVATSTRIQVTGVPAGLYDYQVAPVIGVFLGKDQLNFSQVQQVVVT